MFENSNQNVDHLYVAVAGNIGSGKSTLTTLLAQKFGWHPYYEIVDTNPYLIDFYRDMRRWSFQLQMYFLTKRFQHRYEMLRSQASVIQDRTIYEDAEIFAKNLFMRGKMEERDFRAYTEHFNLLSQFMRAPDLLIYLKADVPTLLQRIALRGRDYEQMIPSEYLTQLNNLYEEFFSFYDKGAKMTIDVGRKDFLNQPKHFDQVVSEVSWEVEKIRNKSQKPLPLGTQFRRRATDFSLKLDLRKS